MNWNTEKRQIKDLKLAPYKRNKICIACNNKFLAQKDYKNNNQKYCSRDCYLKHRFVGYPIFINCIYCKHKFSISPSRKYIKKFCSKKCYSIWQKRQIKRTKLYCKYCNKKFYKTDALIKRFSYKNHFCSFKCSLNYKSEKYKEWSNCFNQWGKNNPAWNGGTSFLPYSEDFNKKLKNRIIEKYNSCCQICGNDKKIAVHHIDYNKTNSNENNLIILCNKCHAKTNYHRHYWINFFYNFTNQKAQKIG